MRVFLVGPPGAGKSTVGKHLAGHLQAAFFDLDEVIQLREAQAEEDETDDSSIES